MHVVLSCVDLEVQLSYAKLMEKSGIGTLTSTQVESAQVVSGVAHVGPRATCIAIHRCRWCMQQNIVRFANSNRVKWGKGRERERRRVRKGTKEKATYKICIRFAKVQGWHLWK